MDESTGWEDISAEHRFEVDGVQFRTAYKPSGDGSFTIVKSPTMIDRYPALWASSPNPRIVEIGIAHGGSVALIGLLAQPSKFLALELSDRELEQLTGFIRSRGWEDRVRVEYGVDQADSDLVRRLTVETFGDEPIDVVIDDASHLYGPTRASFDVLFPRLRPGGRYVIEDWNWQDLLVRAIKAVARDESKPGHEEAKKMVEASRQAPSRDVPLSRFAMELVSACAEADGAVADVTVNEQWISVERGSAELDPDSFRLSDHAADHYAQLAPIP